MYNSFIDACEQCIISKACELLKETEGSVEQIAYETGYPNLSFFYRQFKMFTKKTPANYRLEFYR
ncbi:helix-turn-helix domain-containing protein [uncultured Lutibacter sp.]|uniref:helix-turn-helix domain-containing protein n=1 Tax=uncultured Lutibacter sp. TaxID=437739 RepID=UPI00343F0C40